MVVICVVLYCVWLVVGVVDCWYLCLICGFME